MTVLSVLGLCIMMLSLVAQISIISKQENMYPKPLTDNEYRQQSTRWAVRFGLGALAYIIGLLI